MPQTCITISATTTYPNVKKPGIPIHLKSQSIPPANAAHIAQRLPSSLVLVSANKRRKTNPSMNRLGICIPPPVKTVSSKILRKKCLIKAYLLQEQSSQVFLLNFSIFFLLLEFYFVSETPFSRRHKKKYQYLKLMFHLNILYYGRIR